MIEFRNVSKSYKGKVILNDISLKIDKGSLVCLIGESGCGKTTTLKMINKLITPDTGEVHINNKNIKKENVIKLRRNIGYVIQQTGLFPHLTIKENIEIIGKLEKMNNLSQRTEEMMKMVGLNPSEYLDRYPSELSGGQKQRIGIARAFFTNPEIILMDEPFSALDPVTRTTLQDELLKIQEKFHKTIIFVTHDMDEAIKIADKIAIMDGGYLIQYDTPENILKHPKNDFVRNFVGSDRIWTSPELIKVEDIMVKNIVTAKENFSIFYCLTKMKISKVDSLMIIDEDKKLKGVLYASTLTDKEYENKKAKDFIEDDILVAKIGDSIVDILKIIKEHKINNMPVVDNNGILKGLITRSSLITTLSQQFIKE